MTRFAADTSGATAIEYALLGGLIALVVLGAFTTIGTSVNGMITNAADGFK